MKRLQTALAWGVLIGFPATAAVFRVTPGKSVQSALDGAGPGDTVVLAAGVHWAHVVMSRGGEFGRPIVLAGEPGAVLDGSEDVSLDWQTADDVAPGAWRCAIPFLPFQLAVDGNVITMLKEGDVDPERVEDRAWHWPRVFRDGVGKTKWDGVRALGLYLTNRQELLLKFADGTDPRTLRITVARSLPAVRIVNADRCVVRGLTIRNASHGVLVENATGAVVENCVFNPVDYGVWLGNGAYKCTVRFCEMAWPSYAVANPWKRGSWDNWTAHKRGGFGDRFGIQIHGTSGGHRVHDNWIHDHWDGIEDRGAPGENVGLDVHHNLIEMMIDDGLEPNGAEENCQWHDNVVSDCICGFRIKQVKRGPMYAYRNIFLHNKEDFRNYGERELLPASVFVYHNTSTSRRAIQSNKVWGIGTPGYHYFNNMFVCRDWWGNSGESVEPNWRGDYNVYVQSEEGRAWDEARSFAGTLGLDAHSRWTDVPPGLTNVEGRDVSLTADSPARGAGAELATLLGQDLPGAPPGKRVDAGCLQFGEPMPVIPRKPGGVSVAPAGSWPPEGDVPPVPWVGENLFSDGGFEQGIDAWQSVNPSFHRVITGGAHEGRAFLRVTRDADRATIERELDHLTPGLTYCLVYWSRGSTFADMRVIVRELKDDKYIAHGTAMPVDTWAQSVLRFTVPSEARVRLELSPRTAGTCDLDGFAVYRRRDM